MVVKYFGHEEFVPTVDARNRTLNVMDRRYGAVLRALEAGPPGSSVRYNLAATENSVGFSGEVLLHLASVVGALCVPRESPFLHSGSPPRHHGCADN